MQKRLLSKTATALLVAVMALTGCKKDPVKVSGVSLGKTMLTLTEGGKTATCVVTVNTPPAITMTTSKSGEVKFYMLGTGDVVINWGDGSEPQTVTLKSSGADFPHTYADGGTTHSIAIYGQNITMMYCSNSQLTSLDVTKSTALTYLYCSTNQLTSLDVSNNKELTILHCNNNQLMRLDMSKNLTYLSCSYNRLMSLDVSGYTQLMKLNCNDNRLNSLDMSGCTLLINLDCSDNNLYKLNMSSSNSALTLNIKHNRFEAAGLDALFGTLHRNNILGNPKIIYIINNPGTFGCNKSIATQNGWTMHSTNAALEAAI